MEILRRSNENRKGTTWKPNVDPIGTMKKQHGIPERTEQHNTHWRRVQVRAPLCASTAPSRVQVRAPVSSGLEACGTMWDSIAASAQLFAAHLCTYASWAESWENRLRRAPRLVSHLKRAGVSTCQGLPSAGQSTRAQARTCWANSIGERTVKGP